MTKIISAKYKVSRRLGTSIWGNTKDPVHSKNYRPGQHGANHRVKHSDYGNHLNAKQVVKAHYGRVNEKQFRNIFKLAEKMKGNTAENFAGLLERRLDMVVYRMNFVPTIFAARQLVTHGHVRLNGKKVNIPSQMLEAGDVLEIRDSSKHINVIMESMQKQDRAVPIYLSVELAKLSGQFLQVPGISDIPYPFQPNFGKIVEFYSR